MQDRRVIRPVAWIGHASDAMHGRTFMGHLRVYNQENHTSGKGWGWPCRAGDNGHASDAWAHLHGATGSLLDACIC